MPALGKVLTALFLICFTLAACSSAYSPPSLDHTYTTNTQGSQITSGVIVEHHNTGIQYRYSSSVNDLVGSTVFAALGTAAYFELYVDGRLAKTHASISDVDTFIQLPPGKHQIIWQAILQGAVTIGARSADYKRIFEINLEPDDKAIYEAYTKRIEGIDSWSLQDYSDP